MPFDGTKFRPNGGPEHKPEKLGGARHTVLLITVALVAGTALLAAVSAFVDPYSSGWDNLSPVFDWTALFVAN